MKAVRWERLDDAATNQCIQQNLWRHHAADFKGIRNGLMNGKPNDSGWLCSLC